MASQLLGEKVVRDISMSGPVGHCWAELLRDVDVSSKMALDRRARNEIMLDDSHMTCRSPVDISTSVLNHF